MQERWAAYGEARDERIVELLLEGASDQQIADELGYTKATVGQLIVKLRRKGVLLPRRVRGSSRRALA
jgi:transposase